MPHELSSSSSIVPAPVFVLGARGVKGKWARGVQRFRVGPCPTVQLFTCVFRRQTRSTVHEPKRRMSGNPSGPDLILFQGFEGRHNCLLGIKRTIAFLIEWFIESLHIRVCRNLNIEHA
eukprot:3975208-Pyramimonas_sp.AAC.1